MTRNSASADSSPRVGLPGRYQHNPVPRRHASNGPPGPMPRRHVASDGLTENFRDSPTQHRAGHSRGRQPPAGLSSGPDDPGWSCRSTNGDPGGIRVGHVDRRTAIQVGLGASFLFALHNESSCRFSIHLFNSTACCRPSTQLRDCPSRLRDPQSPSLPKRTIAASPPTA